MQQVASSSETQVDFHTTTRRYISEYITLHNLRCGKLKSYKIKTFRKLLVKPHSVPEIYDFFPAGYFADGLACVTHQCALISYASKTTCNA
jgi:hypothetical protein